MKKFMSYLLILLALVGAFTAFNMMRSEPPAAEAVVVTGYVRCRLDCMVLAKTCCDGCTDKQASKVYDECVSNECNN